MQAEIRRKDRMKNTLFRRGHNFTQSAPIPIKLIEKCFSNDENEAQYALNDLYNLVLSSDFEYFEQFCKIFPYTDFFKRIISLEPCRVRQTALLVFAACSDSDSFPYQEYLNVDILSFLFDLLDRVERDEVTASLHILSRIVMEDPSVSNYLVDQGIHDQMMLLEADENFAIMLAALSITSPQTFKSTIQLIPYCFMTKDGNTIKYALEALLSGIKIVSDFAQPILSVIVNYQSILFDFEQNEITITLFKILKRIPDLPMTFFTPILYKLMNCDTVKILVLANTILQNQQQNWKGVVDEMLCVVLQGQMMGQPYNVQKSCFQTILSYYLWDNGVNLKLTAEVVRFLDDNDVGPKCLFLLCHLLEVYPEESEIREVIESAIPVIENYAASENEDNSNIAQRLLSMIGNGPLS
ncbi:hypothetical protein TRFO_39061 [Tritrichomonas foetus]|uniref:Uncharacterized protein n=1 Tax=Tritrichomonas foetus TaxID=1144522 RepID=A0A1J4JBY7_9EUKA|nr:hypothetical protein TRFO_39061 [Tritrichomonas foetus]|eukprot:OHS94772.1 hypothetical protein TRFO_39061 [Tritrichomonas foetus]